MPGAAGGLMTPVTEPDQQENYWRTKGGQAGLGAATGFVAAPVIGKAADWVARGVKKLVTMFPRGNAAIDPDKVIDYALRNRA